MKANKGIAKIAKYLLLFAFLLVLLNIALLYTGISFTSDKARHVLKERIETLTQRDAYIDGEVRIAVSFLPELHVERIHLKNPAGFGEESFFAVEEVRIQVSLLSLLVGKLHVEEFEANHAHVGLIEKKDGSRNWSLDPLFNRTESTGKDNGKAVKTGKNKSKKVRISIGKIQLTDISIKYIDETINREISNHFSNVTVDLEDNGKSQAEISGSFQGYPYNITFESDAFEKPASAESWELNGHGRIAQSKTRINALIHLHDQAIQGNADVRVQDINLGALLEQTGIITGQDARSQEMTIKASFTGDELTDAIKNAATELRLDRGYWTLRALSKDDNRVLEFDQATLRTSWTKPVEVHLEGTLLNEVISLDYQTNPPSDLFHETKQLDIDLKAHAAGSDIALKGTLDLPVKTKSLQLDIAVKGNDLEKLNRILSSELPPFNNYSLTGEIISNEKGFIIRADDATIGESHLKAAIVIDTSSFKPFWTINLYSRQLQLKDLEITDSKIDKLDKEKTKTSQTKASEKPEEDPGRILKNIVADPRMHFDLNLKVEKLLAGESALGASSLRLKLRDNTLVLDDAELDIPGGKIRSSAAFRVENNEVRGALKLDLDRFEYGSVARYFKPGSLQAGLISARIDLELGGIDFSRLLDDATGKLDIALWPADTKTDVFDIWATNLFLLILPEIRKKESKVNCLVALLDLDDGIMKEDFLGIDTTKVWMFGNINVDFKKEQLVLSLYPHSKTARLFAVQAPIRVKGSFDDIGLITNPVDITAAYVSFVTSPLHVPARRLFADEVPEDASESCERFFDREYVRKLKEELEKEEQKEIDEWLDSD